MTHLYRSLLGHSLYGFMMAAGFVSALLLLNVAGLWEVATGSDQGLLAAAMLLLFNGIAFTTIRFFIHMARERVDCRPSGNRSALPARAAIPVYAPTRR